MPSITETYTSQLRTILSQTLCPEYVDEIVSETASHLGERAEELRATGVNALEAERQATTEFGDLPSIAVELASGYPPKPPFDPKRVRWVPEIFLLINLLLGAYMYSNYGGARGLETAAQGLIPAAPLWIIPGMTAGLARLKYRRLRPLAVHIRMANYGLAVILAGTISLIYLQVTGRSTLTSVYPISYTIGAAGILGYLLMRGANKDGKIFDFMRGHLRSR
jgi:hypothetical protein